MTFSEEIKAFALSVGFDCCGICRAEDSGQEAEYARWISEDCHGEMNYLERNIEKRLDPRLLVEGAQSIISVALNYYPQTKQRDDVPQFAYYAYGEDYHDVVKRKLKLVFDFIQSRFPETKGRCFADSAPVLERFWAARAGLGFIGKNTLLIIPGKGSFFFLGELIVDIELDYEKSSASQLCGKCKRCIEACPVNAIEKPYWLNAKKCISYQTIENKAEIDNEIIPLLSNCVYGCDICQQVCPWNRFSKPHSTSEFNPNEEFLSLDLAKLQTMEQDGFNRIFRKSPVKRAKYTGLKRNVEAMEIQIRS